MQVDNIVSLKRRCTESDISLFTAYKAARERRLALTKLGNRTYVRDSAWQAFIDSMPSFAEAKIIPNSRRKKATQREPAHAA
jgi:hypothetical protein